MTQLNLGKTRARCGKTSICLLAGALCAGTSLQAQFFGNFDETVEPVEPGFFNPWDFSFSDVTIGFDENNTATVTILPGGELVAGLIFLGVGDETASGFLNLSGVLNGDEPRPATFRTAPMETGSEVYIGLDGIGEVNVADGALFDARVVYVGFNPGSSGKLTIDGPETLLDMNGTTLRVGQQGSGVLEVTNGASIDNINQMYFGNLSVIDDATGELAGGGTAEAIISGGSTLSTSGQVRIGNNLGTSGMVTITGAGSSIGIASFLHIGSDGDGVLHVLDGATVSTGLVADGNAGISVPAAQRTGGEVATGELLISGEGSRVDTTTWIILGRGDGDSEESGSMGTLVVEDGAVLETGSYVSTGSSSFSEGDITVQNGGIIRTGSYFRLGSTNTGVGTALITGAGSALEIGSFLQVGFNGNGTLVINDGARVEIPLTGGSASSAGRGATGTGDLTIEGENSLLSVPRFFIGSDLSYEPTGVATVRVRDGGTLTVGGVLGLRNGSTIELDDGTINMEGGIQDSRPDEVDIAGSGSAITGTGVINSDIVLADGGTLSGDGMVVNGNITLEEGGILTGIGEDGILLNGNLTGVGSVDNIVFANLTILSSSPVPAINNSRFAPGGALNLVVDAATDGLIVGDAATDYSNAELTVTFEPFEPGTSATFQLFSGEAALNFASLNLPAGWELSGDGVLQHTGADPDPDPDGAFADWASSFGLTGADAEPDANPSGDGFTNTQKFAFGIDPTVAVSALAEVEGDAETLVLRWNELDGAGITYVIETRSSLTDGDWEEVSGATPVVVDGAPDGYTRFEWTTSVSGGEGQAFYRARAVVEAALLP